jgi:hypothetical protein
MPPREELCAETETPGGPAVRWVSSPFFLLNTDSMVFLGPSGSERLGHRRLFEESVLDRHHYQVYWPLRIRPTQFGLLIVVLLALFEDRIIDRRHRQARRQHL